MLPYDEGYEVGIDFGSPSECPYDDGTVEFEDWMLGYDTGFAHAEEEAQNE